MTEAIACPRCGNVNAASAASCLKCGAALAGFTSSIKVQSVVCPDCGMRNAADATACAGCSTSLVSSAAVAHPLHPQDDSISCPNCGKANALDSGACWNCGCKFIGSEPHPTLLATTDGTAVYAGSRKNSCWLILGLLILGIFGSFKMCAWLADGDTAPNSIAGGWTASSPDAGSGTTTVYLLYWFHDNGSVDFRFGTDVDTIEESGRYMYNSSTGTGNMNLQQGSGSSFDSYSFKVSGSLMKIRNDRTGAYWSVKRGKEFPRLVPEGSW